MDFDVFVSHASEDKTNVVRPLVDRLMEMGLSVWLDEFELTLGDSLRRCIDKGLSRSRFGVVILSPDFLKKEWPNKELDGLVSREDGKGKVILPVWHNISASEVAHFSPILADKVAISTAHGIDVVAKKIVEAVQRYSNSANLESSDAANPTESLLDRIRLDLITATGTDQLRRLLYEVEEILHKTPAHPGARLLRDQIHGAVPFETGSPIKRPVSKSSRHRYRAAFMLATISAIVVGGASSLIEGQYAEVTDGDICGYYESTETTHPHRWKECENPNKVTGYKYEEVVSQSSGWVGGGHDQNWHCTNVKRNKEAALGQSIVWSNQKSSEQTRKSWDGKVSYKYHCSIAAKWGPIYKVERWEGCGEAPAVTRSITKPKTCIDKSQRIGWKWRWE